MRPTFDNQTLRKNDDLIGMHDRRKSVSNDQRGAGSGDLTQISQNVLFGLAIKG